MAITYYERIALLATPDGKITGEHPLSWVEMTGAMILALMVIAVFALYTI